jgi:hypothetical protein
MLHDLEITWTSGAKQGAQQLMSSKTLSCGMFEFWFDEWTVWNTLAYLQKQAHGALGKHHEQFRSAMGSSPLRNRIARD